MKLHRITNVRYTEAQGRAQLERYLFKGMYGGPRVPRGIEPALVSLVIREGVKPDASPEVYGRMLDAARFYELTDLPAHFRPMLVGTIPDANALRRQAYVMQLIGELGTAEQAQAAGEHFDRVIAPHSLASKLYGQLFQTLESLAPHGTPQKLADRLTREVADLAKVQQRSEADMMAHDTLAAVLRNDWPRSRSAIERKTKLSPLPPADRRTDLVKMYLGQLAGGSEVNQLWAGRMLRREAMEADADPVWQEFARAIDTLDRKKLGAGAGFVIVRASQAVIYLLGTLTPPQRKSLEEAKGGAANFLWDDPGT